MRYVIVGAGAVGTSLAAQFEAAGTPYVLVARGAQLAHLREHGLRYRRPEGASQVRLTVSGQDDLALRPGEVLLLCVKTQDVETASAVLAVLPVEGGGCGADLPVVALQNGLAAEPILARRFRHVHAASVRTPAVYTRTGEVRVLAEPWFAAITLGRFPHGTDASSARLAADLSRAGALVEERADIIRWKAQKLLHNVRNALELFAGKRAERERIGGEVSQQAARVLAAAGYDLPGESERRVSLSAWRIEDDPDEPAGQSTWQSFTRGTTSEVDFLNGEIVLLARLHGVPAPWNAAVQRLAAELAAGGRRPGDKALDALAALAHEEAGR